MTEPDESREGDTPGLEDVIALVRLLANDQEFRGMFKVDPARAVAERRINVRIPPDLAPPLENLPSAERYHMLLVLLEVQRLGFNLQAHDGMHFMATFQGPTLTTRKFYGPT